MEAQLAHDEAAVEVEEKTGSPKAAAPRRRRRKELPMRRSPRDATVQGVRAEKPTELCSAAFESYYRAQALVDSKEEFAALLSSLATPLPTVFRLTESSRHYRHLKRFLESELDALSAGGEARPSHVAGGGGGEVASASSTFSEHARLERVRWYPGGDAYRLDAPRSVIRNDARLSAVHRLLVEHNRLGGLNRQEEVSMIPVWLLDVRRGHRVLDLCASPGSKSAQIIDAVQSDGAKSARDADEGVVVANDVDLKRCWMLAHQLKRFAYEGFVVTNHDALSFPDLVSFDRVLCDVPCSGDGTLRKSPELWRRWNARNALPLHRLQVQIVTRAFRLLSVGGVLVYSTCSLNPLENEAVVAELLRAMDAEIELVDVSEKLPLLQRAGGLQRWRVKDSAREEGWFTDASEVPPHRRRVYPASMFPPPVDSRVHDALHRCLRLHPQLQNTGGFFIAVFRRTGAAPSAAVGAAQKLTENLGSAPPATGGEAPAATPPAEREEPPRGEEPPPEKGGMSAKDRLLASNPPVPLRRHDGGRLVPPLVEFYGLASEFVDRLFIRRSDAAKVRRVYAANAQANRLLSCALRADHSRDKRLTVKSLPVVSSVRFRVVDAGVRVFERDDRRNCECELRLVFEGVHVLLPHLRRQVVHVDESDFARLLRVSSEPMADVLTDAAAHNALVQRCSPGSVAFVLRQRQPLETLVFARYGRTLSPQISTEELAALRRWYTDCA